MEHLPISPEIREFLFKTIDSVEQLEILLLLQADASREWTAKSIAERLYASAASVEKRLIQLERQNLLTSRSENSVSFYRYKADTPAESVIASLADIYKSRRIRIIELIFSKSDTQIRSIADAFDLRRQKEDKPHDE